MGWNGSGGVQEQPGGLEARAGKGGSGQGK
jgi:hypothetical protein